MQAVTVAWSAGDCDGPSSNLNQEDIYSSGDVLLIIENNHK